MVDCSNPDMDNQMETVYQTLQKLDVKDKPIVTAFNKIDRYESQEPLKDGIADRTVRISAKFGQGVEEMLSTVSDVLKEVKVLLEKVFSYEEGGKVNQLRKYGQVLEEEYRAEGTYVKAYLDREYLYLFVEEEVKKEPWEE